MKQLPSLPQGMVFCNWDFDVNGLEDIVWDLEIVSGDEPVPSRYFQLYDGGIGNTPMYGGFQCNVHKPKAGWQGKGLLFSRWESQDMGNTAIEPTGFGECGQHEDLFIGVRNLVQWPLGRYTCSLKQSKPDDFIGRWYEMWVEGPNGFYATSGSLRFPMVNQQPPLIKSGGGTWIEVHGDSPQTRYDEDVPKTEVIIHSVTANGGTIKPHSVRVNYNCEFPAANVIVRPDRVVIMSCGNSVKRTTPAGEYKFP